MKPMTLLLMCLLFMVNQFIHANNSPLPLLEKSANQVLGKLSENKSKLKTGDSSTVIHQAVQQFILPHVDTSGMSRSVLGAQAWSKASSQEREAFTKAFTQLVIRTYATPLNAYDNETIHFYPVKNLDKRFIKVNSVVVRPHAKNIPLTYSLVSKNGEWKIYDLSVEGISLLQSFRSQFADALRKSNINEITDQLNQQSNRRAG